MSLFLTRAWFLFLLSVLLRWRHQPSLFIFTSSPISLSFPQIKIKSEKESKKKKKSFVYVIFLRRSTLFQFAAESFPITEIFFLKGLIFLDNGLLSFTFSFSLRREIRTWVRWRTQTARNWGWGWQRWRHSEIQYKMKTNRRHRDGPQ